MSLGGVLLKRYEYIHVPGEPRDAAYTCFYASAIYASIAGLLLVYIYEHSKSMLPEPHDPAEEDDSEEHSLLKL